MVEDAAFIDRLLPAVRGGGFAMEGYWVWCGSVIRGEDGRCHMFASRWPKAFPFFSGYQTNSEIVRASSDTPEGPYRFEEVVLPERGEDRWDGRMTHNPTIHRYGGTYLLYYIGATYRGPQPGPERYRPGRFNNRRCPVDNRTTTRPDPPPQCRESWLNIRIGLATASSVKGPWARADDPILSPRPDRWDALVTTNPAPCVLEDGSVLLIYRSSRPGSRLHLGAARAEHFDAPYRRVQDEPILDLTASGQHVEDPYVWRSGDRLEMIAKDMEGGITGERHAGIHAVSKDGIDWRISDPPRAYSRRVAWDDGTETVQGSLERPQLLIENGRPTHLFAATGDGPGGFRNAANTWNMVIPMR